MELIAGAKMRRAQQRVVESRPYSAKLLEVLSDLTASASAGVDELHPFLEKREEVKSLVIHFTPDRGLCGGLNSNLNKKALEFASNEATPVSFYNVGKKGRDFISRRKLEIVGEQIGIGDFPSPEDLEPVASRVMKDYIDGVVDRVFIVYAKFVNTAVQTAELTQLLPIEPSQFVVDSDEEVKVNSAGYEYEPDVESVLGSLLPRYVEMQIYQAVLENAASEQSARMVAMRQATDAAGEMIEDLNLEYNKARQGAITSELLDLVGGVAALENK
jgi:F-type H+-transporting ATPase subunit gamma